MPLTHGILSSQAMMAPWMSAHWQEFMRGPVGSALHERLAGAEFVDESFWAVSGLNLRPARAEMMMTRRVIGQS